MNLTSRYMVTRPRPPTTILGASQLSLFSVFALNAYGTGNASWMSQSSPWKNEKTLQTPSATGSQPESATNTKISILLEILNSLKIRLEGASKRERGKNKTKQTRLRKE